MKEEEAQAEEPRQHLEVAQQEEVLQDVGLEEARVLAVVLLGLEKTKEEENLGLKNNNMSKSN